MRRLLFNLGALVSLAVLLLITSLAVTVSHGRRLVLLHVPGNSQSVALRAEDAGASLVVRTYVADRQTTARFLGPQWDGVPGDDSWRLRPNAFGFGNARVGRLAGPARPGPLYEDHATLAPWWFLMLVSAALPVLWLTRLVLRRRGRERNLRERRCLGCGYDLRATPGRCPECGAVPADGLSSADQLQPERAAAGHGARKGAR